jgi:hypothetical protein
MQHTSIWKARHRRRQCVLQVGSGRKILVVKDVQVGSGRTIPVVREALRGPLYKIYGIVQINCKIFEN